MSTIPVAPPRVDPAAPPTLEFLPGAGTAGLEPREKAKPARRRRRWGQEDLSPWRAEILARLKKPACLLCGEEAEDLRRYYFWFMNEQYANIPTMERLQRARGFCLRHTRHLLTIGGPSRISFVGEYVLRAGADWLCAVQKGTTPGPPESRTGRHRKTEGFRPPVGCPACETERETRQRYARVIVSGLEEAEIRLAFRASHGLCLPHFLAAAPLAGWDALQCLAETQVRRLEQSRAGLSATQVRRSDGAATNALRETLGRLYGPDLDSPIRQFLVDCRRPGQDRALPVQNPKTARSGTARGWSPAFEETCWLLSQPGCCLCRVAAHGREAYLAWLEEEIRDRMAIQHRWSQTQLLCPEHAWLFAERCDPEVLTAACGLLLDQDRESLGGLLEGIRQPIPPHLLGRIAALPARWREGGRPDGPDRGGLRRWPRVARTLRTLRQGPRDFLDHVLTPHLWRGACPVCHHLQTIEGRAAERLLALLEGTEGRKAFERSYGLCLRHTPLLLERARDPDRRRVIAEVVLARVAMDAWEATEYLRKQSWSVRHEPKAAEGAAWLRAMTRIAGVALEREYDF